MIRYLCSKVNLWEGKYFFLMMEDKMIYQAECLENTPRKSRHKKWGQAPFSKVHIKDTGIKWSLAPFLVHTEKVACPLF